MTNKYFCYHPETKLFTFATAVKAQAFASGALAAERSLAPDGWSENVTQLCWGEIKQQVTEISRRPITEKDIAEWGYDENITEIVDYQFTDLKSESDPICAEEKARQLAKELMLAMNALNASVVGFNHIINGEKYRFTLTLGITRVVEPVITNKEVF